MVKSGLWSEEQAAWYLSHGDDGLRMDPNQPTLPRPDNDDD